MTSALCTCLIFIITISWNTHLVFGENVSTKTVYSTEFLLDYDPDESAWIIDRFGDAIGDLELRFGTTPSQSIKFDTSNNWFAFGSDINFEQNQLKNIVLDNRTSAPANPVIGQVYYNTIEKQTYVWDGVQWKGRMEGHMQNTDTGTSANTFTLDMDNSGGDTALAFGNTVNSYLKWDITSDRFVLNNDIRIEGNAGVIGQAFIAEDHDIAESTGVLNLGRKDNGWERIRFDAVSGVFETTAGISVGGNMSMNGTNLTIDADNADTGQDVSIIANQGTGNDGILRYNAVLKRWEISNDGGAFAALGDAASPGPQGTSGYTTLFAQTAATTTQCAAGGFVFTSGLDSNRNNVLDSAEVATSATICNGGGDTGTGGNGQQNTLPGSCTLSQTASYSGSAQYSVVLSGMDSYSNNTLKMQWGNGAYIGSVSNSNGGSSSWTSPEYLLSILGNAQNFMIYANYAGTPPAGQLPYIVSAQITKNGNSLNCTVSQ